MVQSGVESPVDTTIEMELDLLEEKVQEAATLIERLRNEKRALEDEVASLTEQFETWPVEAESRPRGGCAHVGFRVRDVGQDPR